MQDITKRSLAATAVAGLLVVGGAPAAMADDTPHTSEQQQSEQQSENRAGVGGPIELGGLSFGGEQHSETGQEDGAVETDEDGTDTRASSEKQSSSTEYGVDVGGLTIDPQAGVASDRSSSTHDTDEDRDDRGGEDAATESASKLAGGLGIESEGVSGHFHQKSSDAGDRSATESDKSDESDESAAAHEATRSEKSVGGAFDTGGFALHPEGGVANDSASAQSDDEQHGAQDRSSGHTAGHLTFPFEYDGAGYLLDFDKSDELTQHGSGADEDGTEGETSSDETDESTTFEGELEGGHGHPGLGFDTEDLQQQR